MFEKLISWADQLSMLEDHLKSVCLGSAAETSAVQEVRPWPRHLLPRSPVFGHYSMKAWLYIAALLLTPYCAVRGSAQQPVGGSYNEVSAIVRDPKGLQLLQSAVEAMRTSPSATLTDYTITGELLFFNGQTVAGTVSSRGVGAAQRAISVTVDDSRSFRTSSYEEAGTLTLASNSPQRLPLQTAMEQPYLLPVPLVLDAIANANTSVELITDLQSSSPTTTHIRITRHLPNWRAPDREIAFAQFEVFIDSSSGTVSQISNFSHYDSNLRHEIPHSLVYTDYRAEGNWLVPHIVEESFAGKLRLRFKLVSFTFNSGIDSHEFLPQ